MKKDLMGIEGKLGVIVRNLGQTIVFQGDSSCPELGQTEFFEYSGQTLDDLLGGGEEEGIPTIEQYDQLGNPIESPQSAEWGKGNKRQNIHTKSLGWHFDGLNRGYHLEIKYLGNELSCTYKGYLVYAETAGDLKAFVPSPEWEQKVEVLYKTAKKLDQFKAKAEKAERIENNVSEKKGFLEKIKTLWGV